MTTSTELALSGFGILMLTGLFSDKLSKRNARFPRLILLLLIGVILGQIAQISNFGDVLDTISDPEYVLFLAKFALSLVLFREGLELNVGAFRQSLRSILILSFGAVVLTSILIALTIYVLTPMTFFVALLIAGILAPTDPAATFSMFKGGLKLKAKEKNVIGSESALNDAIAIVLVTELFLVAAEKGKFVLTSEIIFSLFTGFFGGILLGYLLGVSFLKINQALDHYMQTNYLSLALVVLSFSIPLFLQDRSEFTISAAIASLTAGAVFGNPQFFKFPRYSKAHIHEFNEGLSEIGEIVAFGAFGMLFSFTDFWLVLALGILFTIVTLFSRFVVVVYLLRAPSGLTRNESIFVAWGGMRGLATAVLAIIAYQTFVKQNIGEAQTAIKPEVFLSSILLGLILMTIVQSRTLKNIGLKTNSINVSNRKTDLLIERKIIISKLAFYQTERDRNEVTMNDYKELTIPLRDRLSRIYQELQLEIVSRRERMRSLVKELEMIITVIADLGIDSDDLVQHELHNEIKSDERDLMDRIQTQIQIFRLELSSTKSRSVDKKTNLNILEETAQQMNELMNRTNSTRFVKLLDQINSIIFEHKLPKEKEEIQIDKGETDKVDEKTITVNPEKIEKDNVDTDNGKEATVITQKPEVK